MKSLSIIIPYYNTKEYTDELLKILKEQIYNYGYEKEIEVILVDDGSKVPYIDNYNFVKLIRKENGGVSSARNVGLDNATGKYIAFIDSDDLISDSYIKIIMKKIKEEQFDYCYMSWKTFGNGWNYSVELKTIEDEFPNWNCCVWSRVYKRSVIGKTRFNNFKKIAEDAEFIREVQTKDLKKSFISDFTYLYRTGRQDSLTQSYGDGKINFKRIVYNYDRITKDMDYLIDEVKELNKECEVIIMTNYNELPELENYAMVTKPVLVRGYELRGEPTNNFKYVPLPIKTQVIIWTHTTYKIGGLETFIYNFCQNMKNDYDILVLYKNIDDVQLSRLRKIVRTEQIDERTNYICDSLIINRITDEKPSNIEAGKVIGMLHGTKYSPSIKLPLKRDLLVPVSKISIDSFGDKNYPVPVEVINNFTYFEKPKRVLKLISATRLSAEKGESRMINFAKQLNKHHIPFIWYMFTERKLSEDVDGIVYMKPTLDVRDYMVDCDYMVALSDCEAWGYSIVEALELSVPVITTDITVLPELGFEDGVHGFVVRKDMAGIDFDKIYKSKLKFKYKTDNEKIKEDWKKVLGNTVPKLDYKYIPNKKKNVIILEEYYDIVFQKTLKPYERYEMTLERALLVESNGKCKILD